MIFSDADFYAVNTRTKIINITVGATGPVSVTTSVNDGVFFVTGTNEEWA